MSLQGEGASLAGERVGGALEEARSVLQDLVDLRGGLLPRDEGRDARHVGARHAGAPRRTPRRTHPLHSALILIRLTVV